MQLRLLTAVKMVKIGGPKSSIDFVETYNNKAKSPIYDFDNPARKRLKDLYGGFGLDLGYQESKPAQEKFEVKLQGTSGDVKESMLSYYLWARYITMKNVALVSVRVGGGYRHDFVKPYGVDQDGKAYDFDMQERIDRENGKASLDDIAEGQYDDMTGQPLTLRKYLEKMDGVEVRA